MSDIHDAGSQAEETRRMSPLSLQPLSGTSLEHLMVLCIHNKAYSTTDISRNIYLLVSSISSEACALTDAMSVIVILAWQV